MDKKLAPEKVHTALSPADVCTEALLGKGIRELRRLAFVFLCHSEDAMGVDPVSWVSVSAGRRSSGREGTLSSQVFLNSTRLSLKGRVDFTCLKFCGRSHLVGAQSVRRRLGVTAHSSHLETANRLHWSLEFVDRTFHRWCSASRWETAIKSSATLAHETQRPVYRSCVPANVETVWAHLYRLSRRHVTGRHDAPSTP